VSTVDSIAPRRWGSTADWTRPFDELAVGESYRSKRRTVTETDVVRFAGLCAEMNPAHGDPSRYGAAAGRPAQAPDLLPLAYSIGLVPNRCIRALRRILDLELLAPACAGDTIHVEATITRLEPWTEEYGLVTGRWQILEQEDKILAAVTLEAVWVR
jgi:3-hydroxybutyryl-CoA dehydratase